MESSTQTIFQTFNIRLWSIMIIDLCKLQIKPFSALRWLSYFNHIRVLYEMNGNLYLHIPISIRNLWFRKWLTNWYLPSSLTIAPSLSPPHRNELQKGDIGFPFVSPSIHPSIGLFALNNFKNFGRILMISHLWPMTFDLESVDWLTDGRTVHYLPASRSIII